MYQYTKRLRLIYNFRDKQSTEKNESLIKLKSNWSPYLTDNTEFENIIRTLINISFTYKPVEDNLKGLRDDLDDLVYATQTGKIVIKKADKGSITTIISPPFYWDMCLNHLNNTEYYEKVTNDLSLLLQGKVNDFTEKYKPVLTNKEYEYLKTFNYKMANFYMLPKLHKLKRLNEIISEHPLEYIKVEEKLIIEGRPIVGGCVYYTHGISTMIHKIMEPCLNEISHILKDTFDFTDRANSCFDVGTVLGVADIKSLYTNISHDLGLKALAFWIEKLKDKIPILKRFSKQFIIEGMSLILENNYFHINNLFIHQVKGTAMGTHAAVVFANLSVAFLEVKLFIRLSEIFSRDVVEFFIKSYFRFLDDLNYKWKQNIDITPLWKLINELHPDIQFIFENLSSEVNFLDVKCTIDNNQIMFDIYHKPTHSFSYLHYKSCHP